MRNWGDTEKETEQYVLGNKSGIPSSISEHSVAIQYSISNHFYDHVGDDVKIYHLRRNF